MAGESRVDFLLTGASGQVGGELLPLLHARGAVLAPRRDTLDLQDEEAVRHAIREAQPHWIVNPAAYTAVDKAESEPDAAFVMNERLPRILGEEALRCGAVVLHFSTDYVFDGTGTRPWQEDDSPHPLGVYGASKLAGEQALLATGATALIFRTSWVYGASGKNFLKTILRAAGEREELRIVDDQWGAPTWSRNLAHMLTTVMAYGESLAAEREETLAEALASAAGVYHACDAGETTWFDFARFFLAEAKNARPGQRWAHLQPVASAEYPTPTERPKNSRLSCRKLEERFSLQMPSWQESARAVVKELLAQDAAGVQRMSVV